MNSLHQSLTDFRERDPGSAALDQRLRTFFQAQMPEPWPMLRPPATLLFPERFAAPRRRPLFRSRVTLAASLLLLLIGQLVVVSLFTGPVPFAAEGPRGKIEATRRMDAGAVPLSHHPKRE